MFIKHGPLTPEELARHDVEWPAYLERLEKLPQDVLRAWRDVKDADIQLAWGLALRLPRKLDDRLARRAARARSKLNRDPAFRAEVQRLLALLVTDERPDFPVGHPLTPLEKTIWEMDEGFRRSDIVDREGRQFAADHPFPYLAPEDVVVALVETLNQHLSGPKLFLPGLFGRIEGELGAIYVNPLPDTDLRAPVGPGRILVDVTDLSSDDLTALAPVLAKVQARLGYTKQRGRQYEGNAEQMAFVHELRTSPTGRGKTRTWKQVRDMFHKKFGEDISEATLKQRYLAWQRWNESKE
jgi:hypothetical protein